VIIAPTMTLGTRLKMKRRTVCFEYVVGYEPWHWYWEKMTNYICCREQKSRQFFVFFDYCAMFR